MSKKPQYDPEEIRFPDQKIETSYLVHEMGPARRAGRPEARPPADPLRPV